MPRSVSGSELGASADVKLGVDVGEVDLDGVRQHEQPRADLRVRQPLGGELHHLNLKTTRLPEMVEWYALVLGMKPNFRSDMLAFLTNDAANHRIALGALPGFEVDSDRIKHDGLHHMAFEYDSLDKLLGTYLRLKRKGVLPHMCLDHGVTLSFYYLDPDGNSVELQLDAFGDWARSTEFMRTDEPFATKGLGEFVDPDALVDLRRKGASAEEIHERAYAGEFPPSVPPDMRLPAPA